MWSCSASVGLGRVVITKRGSLLWLPYHQSNVTMAHLPMVADLVGNGCHFQGNGLTLAVLWNVNQGIKPAR